MNLQNDVYLEGFRDRVNILEDITGDMLGCDRKNIEKEFGGPIVGVSSNDPSLIAAKKSVGISSWRLHSSSTPTRNDMATYNPTCPWVFNLSVSFHRGH
jgi:hypothetical protein